MDGDRYAANAGIKLNFYITHKIILSFHLIETYEMKERPLGVAKIAFTIRVYFENGV